VEIETGEHIILTEEINLPALLINEREKMKFFDWPSIDSLLPIVMDNGYVIHNPVFGCVVCNTMNMCGENLRGEFRVVPGGDLRLTGYGFCHKCGVLSTIRQHYRQKEDGTVDVQLILRPEPIPLAGADIIPFKKPMKKRRRNIDGQESNHEEGGKEDSNKE
jgi:hypothetical protein